MSVFRKLFKKGLFFYLNAILLSAFGWGLASFMAYDLREPDLRTFFGLGLCFLFAVAYAFTLWRGSKRVNRNIFILIVCCTLSLELYLRHREQTDTYSGLFFHWPRPYIMFSTVFEGPGSSRQAYTKLTKQLDINALGFRGPMPREQKKDGEFRIFVLGGSTVFDGTPLSNSIAGGLNSLFHNDGHTNVKVFNWGQVGYVSGQELALLVHFVCDFSPDLVIFYNGGNDVALPYLLDPRPGYPYNFLGLEAAILQVDNFSIIRMVRFWLYKSSIFRKVYQHTFFDRLFDLEELRKKANYNSPVWKAQIAETYERNIDKACNLARAYGFKLAVFLQPMAHQKSVLTGSEKNITAVKNTEWVHYAEEEYALLRSGLQRLRAQHSGDQYLFADLSLVFQKNKQQIFTDFIHLNKEGNRVIAQRLYHILKPWVSTDVSFSNAGDPNIAGP